MTNKINGSNTFDSLASQMELELLKALLEPDDATYPWNPADDESESYFSELEQQFLMQDVLDEELTIQSQTFYSQLDTLWSEVPHNKHQVVVDNLKETLQKFFTTDIPENWLKAIAQKATEIVASQQSMSDQLVQCVQAVLPTWAADDLFVLARPFAYAMRSSELQNLTSIISNIENREWETLSEIEQARVSIAIAHYALRQMDNSQSQA
jgi:hypothetical protein